MTGAAGFSSTNRATETDRNYAALLIQPRSHAFPNLLGDGLFRIL